jgi:predicted ATPase
VTLGDLFISQIQEKGPCFILETHSEHLLLRIMRRIRETSNSKLPDGISPISPDDVCVLFVESHESHTIVREMPLNKKGEFIKAWPGGFFEESFQEVF